MGLNPLLAISESLVALGIPDAQRKKLDDKSVKCILLGLSDESKAYKLYNPITKKVIISRDVKFAENEKWEWSKGETNKKSLNDNSDCDGEELAVENEEVNTDTAIDSTNQNNVDDSGIEDTNQNERGTEESSEEGQKRTRKHPVWWNDYAHLVADNYAHCITEDMNKLCRALFGERLWMLRCMQ